MGIKDFRSWLKKEYPTAFKDKWLESYDHVFIDLNYSLHSCTYNIKNIKQSYERLYNFLDFCFQRIVPVKSITLCADGSGPLSKLLLQRKRRLTMSLNSNLVPLNFTPSTKFMDTLQSKITNYFNFIKNIFNVEINFDVSGDDEAELKIGRYINNIKNESCIVLSNDGDVILMLMMSNNYENIYIASDKEVISLNELLLQHIKKVGCSKYPNFDFTAMNLFLGNDYLPKVNFINTEKIYSAYKLSLLQNSDGLMTSDLKINEDFLRKFLSLIISQTMKCYISKLQLYNLNENLYSNYFDGYTWCLHTYKNCICSRYNYMYEYNIAPHPLGMVILLNKNFLNLSNVTSNPIDKHLYGILILPKSAKFLIDRKYHSFMEENNILYDIELCSKCNSFHQKLSKIQENIRKSKDDIESKTQYNNVSKQLKLHKINHKQLNLEDIEILIEKFKKFET
jgi:hypothetical protein